MIIDCHTHVPPAARWELFLRECRDNGIALSVVSSLGSWARYPDAADVRGANVEAAQLAALAKGMVLWFAYLNPQLADWPAELERCVATGARGVKLWVSLKDPDSGSLERVPPVLRAAADRGLPVLVHTYQRTDPNLPGEITVAEFAALARAVPEARLIGAHAGGGHWRQSLGLLRGLPNVWVDICGGYPETGMVEALVRDLGAERILFGSDALGRSMASQLAKVVLADIPMGAKATILGGACASLLGVAAAELEQAQAAAAALPVTERLPMPPLQEDHFCFCGVWPFRPSPCPDPAALDAALAAHGFACGYAADAASVYAHDVVQANAAFAAAARQCTRIRPLAAMVPFAPNWEVVLQAAAEGFAGGIVYPHLHNWQLDAPAFQPFFAACAARGFPLWVNVATGDARFRHRGTVCREVSTAELLGFLRANPALAVVVQGAAPGQIRAALEQLPENANVRFEISRLTDTTGALADTVRALGWERLVLGTEFPFRDLRTVRAVARQLCGCGPIGMAEPCGA